MADALTRLLLHSVPPFDLRDLGAASRLLVPNGAAFGTPQLWRGDVAWDWVRQTADHYWLKGDRGSAHSGVDFGFFVRRGHVYPLPAGLPVRAPVRAIVENTGRDADPERGPGGVVLGLGVEDAPRFYVHLTDFHATVPHGAHVRPGQILGHTVPYSRRFPVVVMHMGIGILQPDEPPNPIDPSPLLRRWRVRHPVTPGSTCDASALNRAKPGTWTAPGKIADLTACATWDKRWVDVFD